MFLFDTHVHTSEVSFCGQVPAKEMVKRYADAAYSGFVLTDHYNRYTMERHGARNDAERADAFLKGYRAAKEYGDAIGFDVLFGMELALDGSYNEYLLYGMSEEFFCANTELYTCDLLTLRRLCDEQGILIVQSHPYRPGLTRGVPGFLDGVEVVNGNPRHNSQNNLAMQYAQNHGLMMTSGSDAHQIEDIGLGGMMTETRVTDMDTFQSVLREGSATLINRLGR